MVHLSLLDAQAELAVQLMLAGQLLGIVHVRRLLRQAQVNIAIRWFIGYGVHGRLPDHSSLTDPDPSTLARGALQEDIQVYGDRRSGARIATYEVVHIDASLIRANISWARLVASATSH